jgi:hypothetical protein
MKNPNLDSKFTISDGTRVTVESKGISIIPPKGWEVHLDYPNATLLLQVPYENGMAYQRTIQIMRIKGGLPIDEITGREFQKIIEQKYPKVEGSIADYRMRNHILTKVEDGTPCILFYSEFTLESYAMMQAHILVSSASHHYLLTYTDLAEHFEGEQASQFLTAAWESMVSIQLDTTAPMRLRLPAILGFGAGFIVLLVLLGISVRKYTAGREYQDLLGDPFEDSEKSKKRRPGKVSHEGADLTIRSGIDRLRPDEEGAPTQEVKYIETEAAEEDQDSWNLNAQAAAVDDNDDADEKDLAS